MSDVELTGLLGTNPLGFLAALGALDVASRSCDPGTSLRWTEGLAPHAVLNGPASIQALVSVVQTDLARWSESVVLAWPTHATPRSTLKPDPHELHQWAEDAAALHPSRRAEAALFSALVAEGALDRAGGSSKPTHLDFTAGRKQFLAIVREVAQALTGDDLTQALIGPWVPTNRLPTLTWDVLGQRSYALGAVNPEKAPPPGMPGADWLAFLGLTFLPVATVRGRLRTTACSPDWKSGWFRWPLWTVPLRPRTVRSLLADPDLSSASEGARRVRGVSVVLQAGIRRTDEGGYGSFSPPTALTSGRGETKRMPGTRRSPRRD